MLGHERLLAWRRRAPPALRAVTLGAEQLTQAPLHWRLAVSCSARSAFSLDAAVPFRHCAPSHFTLGFEHTGTPLLHRRPWLLCTLLIRVGSLPLEVLRGRPRGSAFDGTTMSIAACPGHLPGPSGHLLHQSLLPDPPICPRPSHSNPSCLLVMRLNNVRQTSGNVPAC